MKIGDLVTLSSYAIKSEPMWMWKDKVWRHKKPLVGLVVKIEENPNIRSWTSKNESTYYFIKWMQKDGPASRWGTSSYHAKVSGYFYRKDLKFVK
jgi:hypothetical protein